MIYDCSLFPQLHVDWISLSFIIVKESTWRMEKRTDFIVLPLITEYTSNVRTEERTTEDVSVLHVRPAHKHLHLQHLADALIQSNLQKCFVVHSEKVSLQLG